MNSENTVDDYISYGISGVPEIKKEEKEKYLGEFFERVIAFIHMGEINDEGQFKEIESIVKKDKEVKKIIINERANTRMRIRFMKMAKQYDKDFKVIEKNTDIAVVLARVFD